jgi:hypothetical protein
MLQLVQVLGSLLILAAFVAAQQDRLSTQSRLYLSLNFAGAAVLAVLAAHERQVGFLLLEFCWALVAARSLLSPREHADAGGRPRDPERTWRPLRSHRPRA